MLRTMMKSKIHRATVTQADLHYVGSVTVDEDQLAGQQVGGVEQVLVDGHRADVVEVGLGDRGPVDLGLHHGAQHQVFPSEVVEAADAVPAGGTDRAKTIGRLSISRVVPTLAATRIRPSPAAGASPRSGEVRAR